MMSNYNVVLTSLLSRKVLAETELQRLVNLEGITVRESVTLVSETLKELVEVEAMLVKWQQINTKSLSLLKEQQDRLLKEEDGEVQQD